jgi:hypothetical protein
MTENDTFQRVAAKLAQIGHPKYQTNLTRESEIYRDLHIYGMDFAELILWVSREYGVKGTINIHPYCPPETSFPLAALWNLSRRILGLGERQYKNFRVSHVLACIEAKCWIY